MHTHTCTTLMHTHAHTHTRAHTHIHTNTHVRYTLAHTQHTNKHTILIHIFINPIRFRRDWVIIWRQRDQHFHVFTFCLMMNCWRYCHRLRTPLLYSLILGNALKTLPGYDHILCIVYTCMCVHCVCVFACVCLCVCVCVCVCCTYVCMCVCVLSTKLYSLVEIWRRSCYYKDVFRWGWRGSIYRELIPQG